MSANDPLPQAKNDTYLKDSAHSHDRSPNQDALLPPQPLADGESHNSSQETADIVDCCYGGEDLGPGWADEVVEGEEVLVDYYAAWTKGQQLLVYSDAVRP